ncbi:hypothetical protein [Alkaliphilus transvaalensis]|uniref:hypothetical protein n=1 Tax=Alkaliphilus transvaalensis TaxID=114628 RepID=UPI00047E3CAD|nr:hypothetical protein [Alkaliphilus transvaalensis]
MRLVARFSDERDASALIDSLRNTGFDRKDMIVSNLADEGWKNYGEAFESIAFIKTERDSLREYQSFSSGIKGLQGDTGVIVAVETSKHNTNRVREMMEQSGAEEILQD